uniref:Thioredoxin domain-containing protein n=1 Tax=Anser cygnoides TaxID=8845 RepID=A0A8B9IMB9_ANSCY
KTRRIYRLTLLLLSLATELGTSPLLLNPDRVFLSCFRATREPRRLCARARPEVWVETRGHEEGSARRRAERGGAARSSATSRPPPRDERRKAAERGEPPEPPPRPSPPDTARSGPAPSAAPSPHGTPRGGRARPAPAGSPATPRAHRLSPGPGLPGSRFKPAPGNRRRRGRREAARHYGVRGGPRSPPLAAAACCGRHGLGGKAGPRVRRVCADSAALPRPAHLRALLRRQRCRGQELVPGLRDGWKDPNNEFRKNLKLTGVPTLLKYGTPQKLVEEECFKAELLLFLHTSILVSKKRCQESPLRTPGTMITSCRKGYMRELLAKLQDTLFSREHAY